MSGSKPNVEITLAQAEACGYRDKSIQETKGNHEKMYNKFRFILTNNSFFSK